MPAGVYSVRVLAVGGGGGAADFQTGGAGSGLIAGGTKDVTPGQNYSVVVGKGGIGQVWDGESNTAGTGSSIAMMILSVSGGSTSDTWLGPNGGSGGGTGGYLYSPNVACSEGGNGGTGGSDGGYCETPNGQRDGGYGQGTAIWAAILSIFKHQNFTAGAGGLAGRGSDSNYYYVNGGGAGGVLVNGMGPRAEHGTGNVFPAQGGIGYGAGGGSGGRTAGGAGAAGLVYIEWDL